MYCLEYGKNIFFKISTYSKSGNRVKQIEKKKTLTREEKIEIITDFEQRTGKLDLHMCQCCRTICLDNEIKGNQQRCQKCRNARYTLDYLLEHKALPVWRKNGVPMYHIPKVLRGLSAAEKALIQRVSPFVPLTHLARGIMGLSGHTCVFEQDLQGFVNTLPRKLDDVTLMHVVKKIRLEIGSTKTTESVLKVNKEKVLHALQFLKEYNIHYKNIEIKMENLDWMCGGVDTIERHITEIEDAQEDITMKPETEDIGPCPTQANEPKDLCDENIGHFGYINEKTTSTLSKQDRLINNTLQKEVKQGKKECLLNWPSIGDVPVNEYSDTRIFALAFPWLFPGGEGDVKDYPGRINDWGRNMLFYQDGRFDNDDFFSFFAMNYITRHRNSTSSGFFIKAFSKGCPNSLQELQEQIRKGNMSFINTLTYYSKRVKGSSSYWRSKRSELYTWINHHVEKGNGVPMFFITLSCAEYHWHDIIRLLKKRMEMAGKNSSACYVGSKKLSSILNDYSSVVEEYFEKKVEIWLQTVGKNFFGIEHYWVRYEFAPGRGQIHAHLLAMSKDQEIYKLCHDDLKLPNGNDLRAQRLADFVQKHYDMTACVHPEFDGISVDEGRQALSMRFLDVNDHVSDIQQLTKAVMCHNCSGFCMRSHENWYVIILFFFPIFGF